MKKLLIFALAAFVFVACKKDGNEPGGPTLYTIEFVGDGNATAFDSEGVEINRAEAGATITIVTDATSGDNEFTGWNVHTAGGFATVDLDNPVELETTFEMPAGNVKLEAMYVPTFPIVLVVEESGEPVTPQTFVTLSATRVPAGEEVTVTYTDRSDEGFHFITPVGNDEGETEFVVDGTNENVFVFEMPAHELTVTAGYELTLFEVHVADGTAETEATAEPSDLIEATKGTVVTLAHDETATPDGMAFGGWRNVAEEEGTDDFVDATITNDAGVYSFEMPIGNVSVEPIYSQLYVLTLPADVTAEANGEAVESGDYVGASWVVTLTYTGTLEANTFFNGFTADVPEVEFTADAADENTFTFEMPEADTTIETSILPYGILNLEAGVEATIEEAGDPDPVTVTVNSGDFVAPGVVVTLTYTGTPPAGQGFEAFTATVGEVVDTDGVFTLDMPGEDTTIGVTLHDLPLLAELLYLDADGKLALGDWSTDVNVDNMIYTRYGSLVGMKHGGDTYAAADVIFNPTTQTDYTVWYATTYKSPDGYDGGSYLDGDIPYMGDFATYYSSPAEQYKVADLSGGENWEADKVGLATETHILEMIKKGKGDICKLVGLTAAEAKAKIADESIVDYNSGYRLPTADEIRAIWETTTMSNTYTPVGGFRHYYSGAFITPTEPFFWTADSGKGPNLSTSGYLGRLSTVNSGVRVAIRSNDLQVTYMEVRNSAGVRCVANDYTVPAAE